MLVLTRKPGEKIFIGKDVVMQIVRVSRNQVRIGIDAPKDVPIYREELKTKVESPVVSTKKVA